MLLLDTICHTGRATAHLKAAQHGGRVVVGARCQVLRAARGGQDGGQVQGRALLHGRHADRAQAVHAAAARAAAPREALLQQRLFRTPTTRTQEPSHGS